MKRLSLLTHSPIEFYFNQNPKDFVVTEVPLYEFSGEGEHLVLKVAKRGLSTHELLNTLSSSAHIPIKEIGYAGLKDKQAYTIQHISLPKKYEKSLEYLSDENIKILERTLHKNKLKTGHLKGNHFFIRIKKLNPTDATKITSVIESIRKYGFANYFGYQRFGRDGDNAKEGKIVAQNQRGRVNYKKEFLINAYQSELFNNWLAKRVEISKIVNSMSAKEASEALMLESETIKLLGEQSHLFKLFAGDVMCHYPHGRLFGDDDVLELASRFEAKTISPTGLLCGKKCEFSKDKAWEVEKEYIDENIKLSGVRRYAWVWAENLEFTYKQSEAWGELSFYLPKGCYATTLLEQIKGGEL